MPESSEAWELVKTIRKGLDISDADSFPVRTEALNDLMVLFALVRRLEEQFEVYERALRVIEEGRSVVAADVIARGVLSNPVSAPDLDAPSTQSEAFSEGNDGGSGAEASSPASRPSA